jgi:IclR family acetate operon transcriptional repressor
MSYRNKSVSASTVSAPRIQSVGRIAAILDALLAAPNGALQLNELARTCGLVKTTVFTLVDSLVQVGLVDREEHGGYRLGLRNLAYGRAVERQLDIASVARPALLRLCALTRETVNLAVPRPLEAFIVESFEGSQNLRLSSYAGTSAPYHSTACGRAILAFQPPEVVEALCRTAPFKRFTERTLVTPAALETALADCRRRGWAIEQQENEGDASCIAAPIFTAGIVQAAISIAAPSARLNEAEVKKLAKALLLETNAIGRAIETRRASASGNASRVA